MGIGGFDPTNWQRIRTPHSMKGLCVRWLAGLGYGRAPLGAANLYANATQRHEPSRETLAAFAYAQRNSPSADCAPRPLVSELPAGWDGGKPDQPKFLHSDMS